MITCKLKINDHTAWEPEFAFPEVPRRGELIVTGDFLGGGRRELHFRIEDVQWWFVSDNELTLPQRPMPILRCSLVMS
jgi:hypothetical protein